MIAILMLCLAAEGLPERLRLQEPVTEAPRFSIGAHVGWLEMKDAEDGEVFYGLQARLYLLSWLAVEGSVDVARQDFIDDDAELTTVPVQVTGMLFPFPELPFRPYGLVGAGWYFQDVEYEGPLSGLDDDDDSSFGWHAGAGAEILLGRVLMIYADVRYVWIEGPDFVPDAGGRGVRLLAGGRRGRDRVLNRPSPSASPPQALGGDAKACRPSSRSSPSGSLERWAASRSSASRRIRRTLAKRLRTSLSEHPCFAASAA